MRIAINIKATMIAVDKTATSATGISLSESSVRAFPFLPPVLFSPGRDGLDVVLPCWSIFLSKRELEMLESEEVKHPWLWHALHGRRDYSGANGQYGSGDDITFITSFNSFSQPANCICWPTRRLKWIKIGRTLYCWVALMPCISYTVDRAHAIMFL